MRGSDTQGRESKLGGIIDVQDIQWPDDSLSTKRKMKGWSQRAVLYTYTRICTERCNRCLRICLLWSCLFISGEIQDYLYSWRFVVWKYWHSEDDHMISRRARCEQRWSDIVVYVCRWFRCIDCL